MKQNILQLFIISLLLFAGQAFAGLQVKSPEGVEEKVALFTDRSLYIVGEQIQFYATLWQDDDLNKPMQSQVLYCEIITPKGEKMTANKFFITQSSVNGCVIIPDNLLSGTYYFRAYTKLMRNNGPESYAYKQIRIINPLRNELLASENHENLPETKFLPIPIKEMEDMFMVTFDKPSYSARDTIIFTIIPKNTTVSGIKSLCVSAIPESAISSAFSLMPTQTPSYTNKEYLPETRGLSITGKLTEGLSALAVKGKTINLSIIGNGADFMAVRTDSTGRFFFALPNYTGSRDIFLCVEKSEDLDYKIWIDNDYCNLPVNLPTPAFTISEKERQVILDMAINKQIRSHFNADTTRNEVPTTPKEITFYGKPSTIIVLDNYIQLPTLEEYFNELPSQVKVRKHKGKSQFNVTGSPELSFYDPLVLIDGVAVDNVSKILACAPQHISRIEVVSELYVKGDQTFGGIISIISKKGDFAGIDLPSTGIFLNYHFLSDVRCDVNADLSASSIPDARNTILWKPGIQLKDGQAERIKFAAPDTPGNYALVIEGVAPNAGKFLATKVFEVKK